MGESDTSYAITDGYSISWIPTSTQRLDTKLLKVEHPDIYDKYTKVTQSKRFTVKQIKENKKAA